VRQVAPSARAAHAAPGRLGFIRNPPVPGGSASVPPGTEPRRLRRGHPPRNPPVPGGSARVPPGTEPRGANRHTTRRFPIGLGSAVVLRVLTWGLSAIGRFAVILSIAIAACGDASEPAATTMSIPTTSTVVASSTTTTMATTTTVAPTTTVAATTTRPPVVTLDVLAGQWSRESSEHGSEFLRLTDALEFHYADGEVGNLDGDGALAGTFELTDGVFTVDTEDCPGMIGAYALRIREVGVERFLIFTAIDEACVGRGEGLTFGPWMRS